MFKLAALYLLCVGLPCKVQGKCSSLTSVSPNNQSSWATMYSGPLYRFMISNVNASTVKLQFIRREINSFKVFDVGLPCSNWSASSLNLFTQCEKTNRNMILTIVASTPLTNEYNSLQISLSINSQFCYGVNITMKECPLQLPEPSEVYVQSTTTSYNSTGIFDCLFISGKLFYANGTQLQENTTTCLPNATWAGQQMLQCWQAPVDTNLHTLSGPFIAIAGNNVTLNCSYNDVIPTGNTTIFNLGNTTYTIPKGKLFTFIATPQNHDQWLSCQAVTPYTKIFKGAGKSSQHNLFVLYPPYLTQTGNVSCHWTENQPGSCNVTFRANPPNITIIFTKNGLEVKNEATETTTGSGIEQTFHFVKLLASTNDAGRYMLNITSDAFMQFHLLVDVDISVASVVFSTLSTATTTTTVSASALSSNVGAIVGGCIGGFFLLLLLAAVGLYCHRNYNIYISKGSSKSSTALHGIQPGPSGNTNRAMDDEFYIEPNSAATARSKPLHNVQETDYTNMEDNVDVKFGDDSYIELSPVEPQIHSAQSYEYDLVTNETADSPMYESIAK